MHNHEVAPLHSRENLRNISGENELRQLVSETADGVRRESGRFDLLEQAVEARLVDSL